MLRVIGERKAVFEFMHKNTAEEYQKFVLYTTVTRNLIFIIPGVLLLVFAGLVYLRYAAALLGGIIITVCAALFPLFMLLAAYIHAGLYLKKNPWYMEYENTYRFLDDVLYVCSDNKKRYSESVIGYENLHRVVETFGNFYIFINKTQAVIIEKKAMTKKIYGDFREFLIEKLPDGVLKDSLGFKIKKKRKKNI